MKDITIIKIEGHLDRKWKDWFEGLEIKYVGNCTILSGIVRDQPAMHGILNKIRDLNLKLVSINPAKNSNCSETSEK